MRRRSRRYYRGFQEPISADQVLNECRLFVESLGLPRAGSVRELRGHIEQLIGEPIVIGPGEPTSRETPCGMVIRRGEVNYIFYDPDTSPAHQDHIIAHELAHLLKGHRRDTASQKVHPRSAQRPGAGDDEILLGDVDDELLGFVLGRTDYTEDIEREAEGIGSFLQAHVITNRPTPQSESADRITRTLIRRAD